MRGRACEARDAGHTRGALYHRFKDNEPLVLAVLDLVDQTWSHDVRPLVDRERDPVAALNALARGYAVFCRQDLAGWRWRSGSISALTTSPSGGASSKRPTASLSAAPD